MATDRQPARLRDRFRQPSATSTDERVELAEAFGTSYEAPSALLIEVREAVPDDAIEIATDL